MKNKARSEERDKSEGVTEERKAALLSTCVFSTSINIP